MKKLSKRETIILIICLALAAVFAVWQLVIKPMQEGGANIDDRLRLNKARLVKAQKMAAMQSQVERRYWHLVELIGLAGSEGVEMSAIVAKIESAAREANIHIANMQPQRAVSQKGRVFFPVELQVDGQWANIVQFLYSLQQQPNFYFINECNLEKYSETANSLRGRMVLSRMRLTNP